MIMYRKRWSQNFLTDENIARIAVRAANVREGDIVVEIGAGKGILTSILAEESVQVYAYEIDKDLVDYLRSMLSNRDNVHVIEGNFMKADLSELPHSSIKFVANLPYHITSPIIKKVVLSDLDIRLCVFMIQKEVGTRLIARAGDKEYGYLSAFVRYFADVNKVKDVSKNVFYPKPEVDSMIVKLKITNDRRRKTIDEKTLLSLLKNSFVYKRKTLKNNLKVFYSEKILNYLEEKGILSNEVRAESLSIKKFIVLSNEIYKIKTKGGKKGGYEI
ncbi:MAG: ribosomal RNA small subunit methyltransferase A [Thermotogae bacterium]|nr:ribosomal RNA small subunit methyltransferase A [Thermotogota bacterium]